MQGTDAYLLQVSQPLFSCSPTSLPFQLPPDSWQDRMTFGDSFFFPTGEKFVQNRERMVKRKESEEVMGMR